MNIKIEESWKEALKDEWEKPYFAELISRVRHAYETTRVFPQGREIFNAFNLCPFDKVKVIILGQDPYHGPGQAHGLSFSVPMNVPLPPSLKNIYLELSSDLGLPPPTHGDLSGWASQGVLLLNSVLTVESGKAASHQKIGWQTFTDRIIEVLSEKHEHLVFILWGNYARHKERLIDQSRHLIIASAHPSPLSAWGGFFGSCPFSKTNYYLIRHGIMPIKWIQNNPLKQS